MSIRAVTPATPASKLAAQESILDVLLELIVEMNVHFRRHFDATYGPKTWHFNPELDFHKKCIVLYC